VAKDKSAVVDATLDEDLTEAESDIETEEDTIAEPATPPTIRELALMAKSNEVVQAPQDPTREVFVQHKFRSGGSLLTEDGEGLYDGECKHVATGEDVPVDELVYFEFVGIRDDMRGVLHRKRGCQRAFRVETPTA
jgi:hypothetical protein